MSTKFILPIITLLIGSGAGFFAGTTYQKSQRPTFGSGQFRNGQIRPSGMPTRNGIGFGNRPVSGQISAVDDKTITVKMIDGSSKIVVYSDSTIINQTTTGSKDNLKVGEEVLVIGTTGSDNSLTAQTISIGTNFPRPTPTE